MPAPLVRRLRITILVLMALVVGAALPSVASANCPTTPTSKIFLPWDDDADYSLLPGADFEVDDAGWSLENAWIDEGNEPWYVGGEEHSRSMVIGEEGYAASPWFCLGEEHPTFRFFARRAGGWSGLLGYTVRWKDEDGTIKEQQLGAIGRGFRSWRPTDPLPLAQALNLWKPGHTVEAQLVFHSIYGAWMIDDVYVDPYLRG